MSALGQPACAHAADTKRAAAADTKRAAGCISMPAAQVHGGSTQVKEEVRPEDSHNERQRDCIILRCCLQSCTEWPPRRSSSIRFARAKAPCPTQPTRQPWFGARGIATKCPRRRRNMRRSREPGGQPPLFGRGSCWAAAEVAKAAPVISIGAVIKIDLISELPQLVHWCGAAEVLAATKWAPAVPRAPHRREERTGVARLPPQATGFAISELWAHIATHGQIGRRDQV